MRLLPNASVLCISTLAAAAFAAAALGERVINIFHLGSTPVLVTEYVVEPDDAMHGSMVSEIAEGYEAVLLLLERADTRERVWSPDDSNYRLQKGDKLVLLGTPASLEAIERGEAHERIHSLRIDRVLPFAEELELAGVLSRNLGLSLSEARRLIRETPSELPIRLYPRHAERTRRALEQSGARVTTTRREPAPSGAR